MGLPRFELGSYGPKPQMIDQATPQPRFEYRIKKCLLKLSDKKEKCKKKMGN